MNSETTGLADLFAFLKSLEHVGNSRLLAEARLLLRQLDAGADENRFRLVSSATKTAEGRIMDAVTAATGRVATAARPVSAANPLDLTEQERRWLAAGTIQVDLWAQLFYGDRVGFCPWNENAKDLWLPLMGSLGMETWDALTINVATGFCARLQTGLRVTLQDAPWDEGTRLVLDQTLLDLIQLWLALVLIGDTHRAELVKPLVEFVVAGSPPFAWCAREPNTILYLVA